MINVSISGKIVDLERARNGFKSGTNQVTGREWKLINVGVNYYNQFTKKWNKKYFTIWGNDAEDINTFAYEGQEVELNGYISPKYDENKEIWFDEIRVNRIGLGFSNQEVVVPKVNIQQPQTNVVNKEQEVKQKEDIDDSILWD